MQFYFCAPFVLRLKQDIIEGLGCMHDIPLQKRHKLMQCIAKMKTIWRFLLLPTAEIQLQTYLLFLLHTDKVEEEFL